MNVLVVYGTTEGHTRKIAEFVAGRIEADGSSATLLDSADVPESIDVAKFDAVIALGSLHQSKHQRSLTHFIRSNCGFLPKRSAMISCSLTAVIEDDKHFEDAKRCMVDFYAETGWTPQVDTPMAGALLYTKYDWLKRMIMRKISASEGGDTDTSKDFVYTDWAKLAAFVDAFVTTQA